MAASEHVDIFGFEHTARGDGYVASDGGRDLAQIWGRAAVGGVFSRIAVGCQQHSKVGAPAIDEEPRGVQTGTITVTACI